MDPEVIFVGVPLAVLLSVGLIGSLWSAWRMEFSNRDGSK